MIMDPFMFETLIANRSFYQVICHHIISVLIIFHFHEAASGDKIYKFNIYPSPSF